MGVERAYEGDQAVLTKRAKPVPVFTSVNPLLVPWLRKPASASILYFQEDSGAALSEGFSHQKIY